MQEKLNRFLLDPKSYHHSVERVSHIETHISHIFLTGQYAYKIKKAVKFEFLDFTTLEARRKFCEREVMLNKRFAPELYEGVVAICESKSTLSIDGRGKPIEYAVKMKQFDKESLFTELLQGDKLTPSLLQEITRRIAEFHSSAKPAPDYWSAAAVKKLIEDNIFTLSRCQARLPCKELSILSLKLREEFDLRAALINKRRTQFVKALHGDLHLRNIALLSEKPVLFDGIEFNDELSCCDVWADIAFLIMDLIYRGREDLSNLVTNYYLEETDDFEGLALLRLYISYRAAVRAKVSCLEMESINDQEKIAHSTQSIGEHLKLALSILEPRRPFVVAVGGYSGTGKTTLSRALARRISAVHIRSDVVRKHILGLRPLEKAGAEGYRPDINKLVYVGMLERARISLRAGYGVILDGVHRGLAERLAAETLAKDFQVPFLGIWCSLGLTEAKARVKGRFGDASDADEGVVEAQFKAAAEKQTWQAIETARPVDLLAEELYSKFIVATRG